jgi:hypothetical protein
MEKPSFISRQTLGRISAAVIVLALVGASAFFFWPKKDSDSLNVPLGVEQAAIVTYSGPPVAVTPYKWGVAVNVRIAKVIEQPGARIYDVRYIVNRSGTFDLKDYLTGEDGHPLAGLPSFKFDGDPKLSKELDARIQETEEVGVDVGGHYYLTLAALAVIWIVWLLLLIFYGRAKPHQAAPPPPPAPTLAELLRGLLRQLEAGTLDVEAKAKMEMLLLRRWREELAIADAPMITALDAIGRHEKTGAPLRLLQRWLHHPTAQISRDEIVAFLTPYTVEPAISQAAPAPAP